METGEWGESSKSNGTPAPLDKSLKQFIFNPMPPCQKLCTASSANAYASNFEISSGDATFDEIKNLSSLGFVMHIFHCETVLMARLIFHSDLTDQTS